MTTIAVRIISKVSTSFSQRIRGTRYKRYSRPFPLGGAPTDKDEQSWDSWQPLLFATINSVGFDEFFEKPGRIRLASESRQSGALYLSFMIFVFLTVIWTEKGHAHDSRLR